MERREGYPNLDLKQSGNLLRYQIRKSGYSVRDIQNYLVLSCPQPVYREAFGEKRYLFSYLEQLRIGLFVQ